MDADGERRGEFRSRNYPGWRKQLKLMQSGSNVVLHYTDVSGKSQAEVFCTSVLIHSSLVHFLAFSKLCRRVELRAESEGGILFLFCFKQAKNIYINVKCTPHLCFYFPCPNELQLQP